MSHEIRADQQKVYWQLKVVRKSFLNVENWKFCETSHLTQLLTKKCGTNKKQLCCYIILSDMILLSHFHMGHLWIRIDTCYSNNNSFSWFVWLIGWTQERDTVPITLLLCVEIISHHFSFKIAVEANPRTSCCHWNLNKFGPESNPKCYFQSW